MAEQWFYRMFGHDFGPVTFEELKGLADTGAISSEDDVRPSSSSNWVSAKSVAALGLVAPTAPVTSATPPIIDVAGVDDWYCRCHGQELGPLNFEEILAFAKQDQLDANDEVKLGAQGKWRRVGSIGRLVAVLPYHKPQAPKPKITASNPNVSTKSASLPAATNEGPQENSAVVQAQATYATMEQNAQAMIAWASAPNVDPAWWGWIGGVEYGPTGFAQIYEWALAGRIQPSDFVKNGVYGQYAQAASVPGLFNAVDIMLHAREALNAAQASAATVSAAVIQPATRPSDPAVETPKQAAQEQPKSQAVTRKSAPSLETKAEPVSTSAARTEAISTPAKKSEPVIVAAQEPKQAETKRVEPETQPAVRAPVPDVRPAPAPAPATSTFASSSFSSAMGSSPRPAPVVPRPVSIPAKPAFGSGIGELLKDPQTWSRIGIAAVVLLVVGWFFMPASTAQDVERYRNIKQVLDDVRKARASKSTNFDDLKARAEKLKAEYTPSLAAAAGASDRVKQCLLFAVRDDMPQMMKGNLAEESLSEKNLDTNLKNAASILGIQ